MPCSSDGPSDRQIKSWIEDDLKEIYQKLYTIKEIPKEVLDKIKLNCQNNWIEIGCKIGKIITKDIMKKLKLTKRNTSFYEWYIRHLAKDIIENTYSWDFSKENLDLSKDVISAINELERIK